MIAVIITIVNINYTNEINNYYNNKRRLLRMTAENL